jgi:hypothetical protein
MSKHSDAGGAHTFTLTDADGKVHSYTVTLHPVDDGQRIMWRLLGAGAEPLARLLDGVAKSPDVLAKIGAAMGNKGDRTQVADLVAGLNIAGVGADVRAVITSIDMSALVVDLLACTYRDDQPMRDPHARNAAYRGNYAEMLRACWEVVRYNRFLPGFDMLAGALPALSA